MTPIRIRVFNNFNSKIDFHNNLVTQDELQKDPEYNVKYSFTHGNDYTHAILLNTPMPPLSIPPSNVIGISQEPYVFLGLSQRFINYAKKHVGKYYIGEKRNLPLPFVEKFGYKLHHMKLPASLCYNKPRIMSIMVSSKQITVGHRYRHLLIEGILRTKLPIDIYGNGCNNYKKYNDERVKGGFDDPKVMFESYQYHISIENVQTPEYISEKIIEPLLCNTIPVYFGCTNIEKYFENMVIVLTGNVSTDLATLQDICNSPEKYKKTIDMNMVKKNTSIKNVIENDFYSSL